MKYITSIKSIGVVCVACSFVLGSIFVFMPIRQVDASDSVLLAKGGSKSDSKKSGKPSSKPKKSSDSKLPSGGKKSNNSYAKKSLSGNCKKVGKYCVTFSKSGCGNFYIKGRHYGGSQSCRILGKKCDNGGGGGNNNTVVTRTVNVKTTATTTKQVATSTLQRECTPGVDCPQDDLGPIIRQTLVTPAYAAKNSNTCPLFWVAGEQTKDSTIKCTLVFPDGTKNDVPTDPLANGYESGYPLPVGKSTLVCLRSTTYDENVMGEKNGKEVILSTTKKVDAESQEKVVECKQNPAVREL